MRVPMTVAGAEKLRAELQNLKSVVRPSIIRAISEAREHGDLKENAEYHGARESQGMLQAKINLLRGKLAKASIVDPSQAPKDKVAFGATVVVKDLDYGDEEEFTLVGAGEEDYDTGKILISSPVGQGLLGKKVGERAEIAVPRGKLKFEIVAIRYE